MKHFVIQTIDNHIKHDFSFQLINSLDFWKWKDRGFNMDYTTQDLSSKIGGGLVPVGSVEFVLDYIERFHGLPLPKPKNIPEELMKSEYTGRRVYNGTEKDIFAKCVMRESNIFIKQNDVFKGICGHASQFEDLPEGSYQISDLVEFITEWRAFVFQGRLVGLHNYSGDFTRMPNINTIYRMISDYKSQPVAFTLDVGIIEHKALNPKENLFQTVIVEVHDFFSCGLYGFSSPQLPFMFSQWYEQYIYQNTERRSALVR